MITWTNQKIQLSKLKPATYNPRKSNKKSREVYIKNEDRFGNAEPIVVNQDYTIIGGHMRYFIYLEEGRKEVEVMYPSKLLSDKEEKALNIKLNSISGFTNANKIVDLGLSFSELRDLGFDEIKLPEPKKTDGTNVIAGKEKNLLIYNLYYFPSDFHYVQGVIKKIQDREHCSQGQAVYKLLTEY